MKESKVKIKILVLFLSLTFIIHSDSRIEVELKAIPSNYEGICPVIINFEGEIFSLKNAKIQYRFLRSDKTIMPIEVLEIPSKTSKRIKMQWNTSIDLNGWVQVEILSPIHIFSKKINFNVKCLGILGTQLKSDLILKFQTPISAKQGENFSGNYKLLVSNIGNVEAENFYVDIVLKGWAGLGLSTSKEFVCGRGIISSIQPSEDAIPSGLFPSIPLDILPGKYELCAIVDSTNVVQELEEENNQSCSPITILEKK